MNLQKNLSADFAKTNMTILAKELDSRTTLTLIAPSGFGKSLILKYLTYNHKYKRRYRSLSKIEFIYVDCTEIIFEDQKIKESPLTQNNFNQVSIIEVYEKVITNAIIDKLADLSIEYKELLEGKPVKEQLYISLDLLIKNIKEKRISIIFNYSEKILASGLLNLGELLRYLRNKYREHLNYIFTLESTSWLNYLNNHMNLELAILMNKKIVAIRLSTLKELLIPKSVNIGNSIFDKIYLNSGRFKSKLEKLQTISGGYFPYAHALWNTWDLRSDVTITEDLISSTLRLFSSLTHSQIEILKNIALNRNFNANNDLNYLLATGLVIQNESSFRIFSPILKIYFQSRTQSEN